ncbi:MAG: response regulator transcription factor [Chloroflexi bacterium]|nr:response regulator transcription factor [Chloroflexota bacterium]
MPSVKRILVVDDDDSICQLMVDVLEYEGWSVMTAHNGAQALVTLRASAPDLVLLDLTMPVLDGWGVLAERRQHADLRAVPVLAMSAGGSRGMDQARAMGANGCMPKPFELGAIVAALESLHNQVGELD